MGWDRVGLDVWFSYGGGWVLFGGESVGVGNVIRDFEDLD